MGKIGLTVFLGLDVRAGTEIIGGEALKSCFVLSYKRETKEIPGLYSLGYFFHDVAYLKSFCSL